MILTDNQIDSISCDLDVLGIKSSELKDDILDHICSDIEARKGINFDEAYQTVIKKFGGNQAIEQIQKDTDYLLNYKRTLLLKRALYISGFIVSFLMSTGIMFKVMQWPFAGMILLIAFVLLNFVLLPIFFYERYTTTNQQQSPYILI